MPTVRGVTPLSLLSPEERTRRAAIAALVAWTLARPAPRKVQGRVYAATSLECGGIVRQLSYLPDYLAEGASLAYLVRSTSNYPPVRAFDLQQGGMQDA